jgi:hypothetical protein
VLIQSDTPASLLGLSDEDLKQRVEADPRSLDPVDRCAEAASC